MPVLHIIEGPVGAGKTTYAMKLGRELGVAPLVLDAWMVTLFQTDRPESGLWEWYGERKARCMSQILSLANDTLAYGRDAIIEVGLVRAEDRLKLFCELDAKGCLYRVHVLDAPREERQRRVTRRNTEQGETFAMHVSDDIFAMASDMWEPVCEFEQHQCQGQFNFV